MFLLKLGLSSSVLFPRLPWLAALICCGAAAHAGPQTADVRGFEIAPTGLHIVYLADQDQDERVELYSTKIGGGPSVKLNARLRVGSIVDFFLSPRGRDVVYVVEVGGRADLFSVPIDGGSAVQLNLRGGRGVEFDHARTSIAISPDSKRLLYLADQEVRDRIELYAVSLQGGKAVKLSPPLGALGEVYTGFQISPDGERVVFRADPALDHVDELFSAPIDGSQPAVQLSSALVSGRNVEVRFRVSPDSERAVFAADQETTGVREVFSAPLDGSEPAVKLNGPLVTNGNAGNVEISSDGASVVYMADAVVDEDHALFAAPIDGSSASVQLTDGLYFPGGLNGTGPFQLGQGRAVYSSDRVQDEAYELLSAPFDASAAPILLDGPVVRGLRITPDGDRALYLADQDSDQVFELFSVPIGGGASPIQLSAPLAAGERIGTFAFSPDGSRVVYERHTSLGTSHDGRLFSAPVDGGSATIELTGTFVPGGDVTAFSFTPDGLHVVYSADQLTLGVIELFSVPIDGSQPPKQIVGF